MIGLAGDGLCMYVFMCIRRGGESPGNLSVICCMGEMYGVLEPVFWIVGLLRNTTAGSG